ncbi:MAG: Gfo/Idh/MocA family oxidoreductase [bacterium]
MLSVGVIGCGRNSVNHLRVYDSLDGTELVAVCDVDEQRARKRATQYGAKTVFTEVEELLDTDLDLVDIVTPVDTHADLTEMALQAGKNVLVEKPMALTSQECLRMIKLAREAGKTLSVVHNKRFYNCVREAKRMIRTEGLQVTKVRTTQHHAYVENLPEWAFREELGGLLWESLTHHVYLAQYFMPEIDSVYAVADRINYDVYDSITVVLKGEGRVAICDFEADSKEPVDAIHVSTREGGRLEGDLQIDYLRPRNSDFRTNRAPALRSLPGDIREPLAKGFRYLKDFLGINQYGMKVNSFTESFFTLISELISYLEGESDRMPVSPQEGLAVIRILEAARKSIETGRPRKIRGNRG